MTNIDEIHQKMTIVCQQQQQTNSLDRDHYVARGQLTKDEILILRKDLNKGIKTNYIS